MERQVFDGLRVLDLSRWVAGEFCTKLFADFGADVVKIEKPGAGSLTRRWGPFPGDEPHPEKSALFLHLNTNKRSVTLDLTTRTGRKILLSLVERADLVVESFRPGTLAKWDLGWDVLRAVNPKLSLTRISAFGQTGPYRDREATGIVMQAIGGPMNATGDASRPPLKKPGLLEHYTIGRAAAQASMAALLAARRFGAGSEVDVAGVEVLLSGADRRASYLLTAAYSGVDAPRGVRTPHRGRATYCGPFRCKDGYVMIYVTNMTFWHRFADLVGEDDPSFPDTFRDRLELADAAEWDEIGKRVASWFAVQEKQTIMERGQAAKVPLTALVGIDELFQTVHFRERGAFVPLDHPVAGRLEYVGAPWRMRGGWQLRSPAPLLGADTADVLGEMGVGSSELPVLRGQGVI